MLRTFSILVIITFATTIQAQQKTYSACAADYYKHCSEHSPESQGVKTCMRKVGPNLSHSCINALIEDGYVSREEVIAYAGRKGIKVASTSSGKLIVIKKNP